MPLTLQQLDARFDLKVKGPIRWLEPIPTTRSGVYIISTSNDVSSNNGLSEIAKISKDSYKIWKENAPGLMIKGACDLTFQSINNELQKYWHPLESIVYIGKANNINKRLNQFYNHVIGESRPLAGGFWIKLLENLNSLFIYYSENPNPKELEFKILLFFIEHVAGKAYTEIKNIGKYLPFGNLRIDLDKNHLIEKQI